MTYHEKIHKAVVAHFACHKSTLVCEIKLEDSVDAAKAFYEHLKGTGAYEAVFNKLMIQKRYRNKLQLIKRYLTNEN